jgi:bis(5'-nucleosyl)-tetraphosphatase (symmetrical)
MATYAIGDLQGCWLTLDALLHHVNYRPKQDALWFVGDIVNRGQGSLECLRFIASPQVNAVVVLGNHDLHLLAVAEGIAKPHRLDTLAAILDAPDCAHLLYWLRQQKLLHTEGAYALVHAGLMPQWTWRQAATLAREIERELRGDNYRDLLQHMYGNKPDTWADNLAGHDKMRFVLNTFTRMRTLTDTNAHDLGFKGELSQLPSTLTPWFNVPSVRRFSNVKRTTIAGHWSALGLYQSDSFIGLDSGCIWGRTLTAYRLDDGKIFQMPSQEIDVAAGLD